MNITPENLKNIIKDLALKGLAGVAVNDLTEICNQVVHQAAQHARSLIHVPQIFQFYSCGFIHLINSPIRGPKRVALLHPNWDGTLVDEKWINGALQTTALRKRPNKIRKQKGDLGYSKGKTLAIKHAQKFLAELRKTGANRYPLILKNNCESLQEVMESIGLFWTFGRSQKFFNILTKYWYCVATGYPDRLKSNDLELVKNLSVFLDAPIDSNTLKHIRKFKYQVKNLNLENVYWGWNMDRRENLSIQKFLETLALEKGMPKISYELIEVWQLSDQKK